MFSRTIQVFSNSRLLLCNSFRVLQITSGNNVESVNFSRTLKTETRNRLVQLQIPDKPKRPVTPYARFVQEKQFQVAKQHPEWKQSEIFKKLAEDWKNVSVEQKEQLVKSYKEERNNYDREILKYQGSLTDEQREALEMAESEKRKEKERRKLKKLMRETNKPKRPMGPFMLYLAEQSKMRNMKIKDLMSMLKNDWMNMPLNEKEKYKNQYDKEYKDYEGELRKWEDRMIKLGHTNLVRAKSLKEYKPTRVKRGLVF